MIFGARAASETDAMWGIRRMRFATGVDDDLRPFYDAFRDDPVIGKAVRERARAAVRRPPLPWESLVAAICEQLIEFDRAVRIQRRLIGRFGARCPATGLSDAPPPAALAGVAPAQLVAMDLAPDRALTLRRAAAEVAGGRVDLLAADPMPGWRRLRAIPGIGPWTLEMLALHGQGRFDRVPAGDLGYLKLVGRITTGNPRARADVDAVHAFFAPYGEWKGLAGEYLRIAAAAASSRASVLLERVARVEPLAGQELVRHDLLDVDLALDEAVLEHPVGVGLPLGDVLEAPRLRLGVGEEDRQRRVDHRLLRAPVEPRVGGEQPVQPELRVLAQRLVPARRRLHEAAHLRPELLVEVAPPHDEHQLVVGRHAELVHALDLGSLPRRSRSTPSTFQYAPSVASTLPDSIAGTRLKPTLVSLTEPGSTPAFSRIVRR